MAQNDIQRPKTSEEFYAIVRARVNNVKKAKLGLSSFLDFVGPGAMDGTDMDTLGIPAGLQTELATLRVSLVTINTAIENEMSVLNDFCSANIS